MHVDSFILLSGDGYDGQLVNIINVDSFLSHWILKYTTSMRGSSVNCETNLIDFSRVENAKLKSIHKRVAQKKYFPIERAHGAEITMFPLPVCGTG